MPTTNGPAIPVGRSAEQDVLHALADDGAERDREQQQEREARRRVTVEPEQPAGGDRDPRARDSRHRARGLREPDRRRPAQREVAHLARSGRRSAQQSTSAKTAIRIAICHGSPRCSAIRPRTRGPTTAAGIVATSDDPGDALLGRRIDRRRERARARRATSSTMSRQK